MKYILIILTIFSLQGFVALEAQSKPIKRTRATKRTLDDISKNSTALIGVHTKSGLSTGSGFFINELGSKYYFVGEYV